MNNQERGVVVNGHVLSSSAIALLVRRTLPALPRDDQVLLSRILERQDWDLLDAALIERIRPFFEAEVKKMLHEREARENS